MNGCDLDLIFAHFEKYSDKIYCSFLDEPEPAQWFRLKEKPEFKIVLFSDNTVFRVGDDNLCFGTEIITWDDLLTRARMTAEQRPNQKLKPHRHAKA